MTRYDIDFQSSAVARYAFAGVVGLVNDLMSQVQRNSPDVFTLVDVYGGSDGITADNGWTVETTPELAESLRAVVAGLSGCETTLREDT